MKENKTKTVKTTQQKSETIYEKMNTNMIEKYLKDLIQPIVDASVMIALEKLSVNQTPQYAYSGVELAKHLGCSKSSVSRYKAEGKFDGCFKQIDRTVVYDLNKIDEKFGR